MEDFYNKVETYKLFLRTSKLIKNNKRRINQIGYYNSCSGKRTIPPIYRKDMKSVGFNEAYISYLNIGGTFDYATYKNVILAVIDTIKKLILEGVIVKLPQRLGYIGITSNTRRHKSVNWWKTNQNKKDLLLKGIQIKTKDNPNGKEYFIYRTNPKYPFIKWGKRNLNNAKYFYFQPLRPFMREMYLNVENNSNYLDTLISKKDFYSIRLKKNERRLHNK